MNPTTIIFLTVFIDLIGFGIIIPLMPFYAETVGASALTIGLLNTSFSLMQFLFAPFGVALIDNFGWQAALTVFAGLMLLIVPLALALVTPPATTSKTPSAGDQSFKTALAEAFGHRSYVLLVLGFIYTKYEEKIKEWL